MGRQITEHFNEDELRCHCGCGLMLYTDAAVRRLEGLREVVGFPLRVHSGYRCPDHNSRVSKTGRDGPHTIVAGDNVAVDLGVYGDRALLVTVIASNLGFTGFGWKQTGARHGRFVHLDRVQPGGDHPRPWPWSY